MPAPPPPPDPQIGVIETGTLAEGYLPVRLQTPGGEVRLRYYPAAGTMRGVLWVGGVGGGWDTPAHGLYPRLSERFQAEGIAALRVRFRHPSDFDASVVDVLSGITFLKHQGITDLALVGHSFGGAVVIQAAAMSPVVRTVVGLAPQSYGAEAACELAPRASILLIHGGADTVLPDLCSRHIYGEAQEPKQLIIHEAAGRGLDEAAGEVQQVVHDWIVAELQRHASPKPASGSTRHRE